MKRKLLIVPVLLVFYILSSASGDKELKVGKSMPLADREMAGTDGKPHTLNSLLNDNGLIVIFSCNTCPFVVGSDKFEGWEKQYNDLNTLAASNKIGLVLINSNEAKREGADSMEEMIKHGEDAKYSMPYLVDENSELADACGAKTTPHVFVFSSDKKLLYKGSIDNSWDSQRTENERYLNNVIEHLGKGTKLMEKSTSPRGCSIKRVQV